MTRLMARSGLREPVYSIGEASVRVTLFKQVNPINREDPSGATKAIAVMRRLEKRMGRQKALHLLDILAEQSRLSNREIAEILQVTPPTARGYLRLLEDAGLVTLVAKSSTDPTAKWQLAASPYWLAVEAYLKAT